MSNTERSNPTGWDRRQFLKTSACAAAAAGALGVGAVPARATGPAGPSAGTTLNGKTMVVLFLRGGADGLSLVAPAYDNHFKTVLRPTIRVGEPNEGTGFDGLPLTPTFAMSPHMPELQARFTATPGGLAIVHALGYPDHQRSHFESQDIMERGLDANDPFAEGWVNRLMQMTTSPTNPLVRALKVGDSSLPDALIGSYTTHAARTVSDFSVDLTNPDMLAPLRGLVSRSDRAGVSEAERRLSGGGRGVFDLEGHFAGLSLSSYVPSVPYPSSSLGDHLQETAMLIKAGLNVDLFWVDTGGWDHHSDVPGNMATRAPNLSASLDAFVGDLGTLMNDVCVVVMSEFGRTADENGSLGTDHGKGGVGFCIGGAVNGGMVHGVWPGVGPTDLENGRFLVPSNDYRDLIMEVLINHLGMSVTAAEAIFDGFTHTPLGVF